MSRSTANWLLYAPLVVLYVVFVRTDFAAGSELLDEVMDSLGLLIALTGVLIRIYARDWKPSHLPDGLVTTGPYAVVRNPMYVGSFLIGLGLCVIIGNLPFLALYTVLYVIVHAIVVRGEARTLSARWPEEYAAYTASVPACIPNLRTLGRELAKGTIRLSSWKRATARELDPLCGAFVGSFALEAREDYLVEGWKMAHHEVVLFVGLAVLFIAVWAVCSSGPVRRYLTAG